MITIVSWTALCSIISLANAHAYDSKNQKIDQSLGSELLRKELLEEKTELTFVDIIEINVESRKITAIQKTEDGQITKIFSAATASPKNTIDLPFEKSGRITKIVFNPSWKPSDNIQKENLEKFGKKLPKIIPPGKDNPLGKVKLFIAFANGPYDLGIHGTNKPKSIGKRVSHGCNRLRHKDVMSLANLILTQNGEDFEEILRMAEENPQVPITIKIVHGPEVFYKMN
jgi:hypothetical protein